MKDINKLLRESTDSASSHAGRPTLVSLTKALNRLIYKDLVAIQPTDQPTATIFGIKFNNPNKKMTFKSPATYGGQVFTREGINDASTTASYKAKDVFKYDDVVYVVTKDSPFEGTTLTDTLDVINEAIINGTVRYYSDAATTDTYESNDAPSEVSLAIDKWQVPVKSRKLSTSYSIELLQDMKNNELVPDDIIDTMLAETAALEINKEIVQKLITVSSRYKVNGVSDKGFLDITGMKSQEAGRLLYQYIAEMNASIARETSFAGTYVLASTRVIGVLDASGLLQKSSNPLSSGVLNNGLEVFSDIVTPMDYMIVGVKYSAGDFQNVGSLFYAPYTQTDGAGTTIVINDPKSLQPKAMILNRYALSVNPFTTVIGDDESEVIDGDDWDNLVGVSKMSNILGVKLTPLAK